MRPSTNRICRCGCSARARSVAAGMTPAAAIGRRPPPPSPPARIAGEVELVFEPLQLAQRASRVADNQLAHGGRAQAPGVALEQRASEQLLHIPQHLGERGLGQAERGAGAGQGLVPREGVQQPQVAELQS